MAHFKETNAAVNSKWEIVNLKTHVLDVLLKTDYNFTIMAGIYIQFTIAGAHAKDILHIT